MNAIEPSSLTDLGPAVAGLIKNELRTESRVKAAANEVILPLPRHEVDNRMGQLLQHIYRSVDSHFPERKDHLSLVIRDAKGSYENRFKIWKQGV